MNNKTGQFEELIYVRTYARWLDEEQRREKWDETVARYRNYFLDRFELSPVATTQFNNACDMIQRKEVMPSMRCLWTAGKALDVEGITAYNCSFLLIDSIKSFADLAYLLLSGTGVGYSIERQVINKLPTIIESTDFSGDDTVVFEDSKLGWATGLLSYMTILYDGHVPKYDLSKIRPKGARLKTFGGKAGGPDDLKLLLDYLKKVFVKAQGRQLTSLECHDICCFIANVVVSAGIRRSACISLSNLSDTRMRDSKIGEFWKTNPQRAMANNSTAYTEKPDMHIWMKEWTALMDSGAGERGIFNREAAFNIFERLGRQTKDSNGDKYIIGLNPCFTGDMELLTDNGYKKFRDLSGKDVNIVNIDGDTTTGKVWHSGLKHVVEVRFSGDTPNIRCTPDHVFMLADHSKCKASDLGQKRLMPHIDLKTDFDKESFLAGFIQGDGGTSDMNNPDKRGITIFLGKNDDDIAEMYNQQPWSKDNKHHRWYSRYAKSVAVQYGIQASILPIRELPKELPRDFLSGLFSANGCVIKNTRVALKTTCKSLAHRLVDELVERYGIESYITTNKPNEVEFSNGTYLCRENYDVNIGKYSSLIRFAEHISFGQEYKQTALYEVLYKRAPFVRNVVESGMDNVYDFNEPITHWGVVNGVIVSNCGEIVLRPNQVCNLTECIIRPHDTLKTLMDKVETAVVLGCMQSCLTHTQFLGPEWKLNMEDERLLGVSMTGVRDHPVLNKVTQLASLWLTTLREHARVVATDFAEVLGINTPMAITTSKPSGTVSSLTNASAGIHTRFSPYYIRRVRIASTDAVCKFLMSKDVPHHPEVGEDAETANTWVFEFPIKSPDDAIFDTSALEQLEYWKMFKTSWTEHNPSVTIMVEEHEWMEVGAWVYKNWDIVGGMAFLPKSNNIYQLAPFEAISKDTYDQLVNEMPIIDFASLTEFEREDETVGGQTLACVGGACDIQ